VRETVGKIQNLINFHKKENPLKKLVKSIADLLELNFTENPC
jgi:hypothetical protein